MLKGAVAWQVEWEYRIGWAVNSSGIGMAENDRQGRGGEATTDRMAGVEDNWQGRGGDA